MGVNRPRWGETDTVQTNSTIYNKHLVYTVTSLYYLNTQKRATTYQSLAQHTTILPTWTIITVCDTHLLDSNLRPITIPKL